VLLESLKDILENLLPHFRFGIPCKVGSLF
jgi:hypothetical protein